LDTVSQSGIEQWQPGDTLLLSGKMLTGRDAAHKKMIDMLANDEQLPVDLTGTLYLLRRSSRSSKR
jgi:fumarate hydratase class I